ncbi:MULTISPECIES: hypothetical protein [Streptomyces]|uniref:hypothetical protein n=1 Tax=Streptomyces TaxID=1883 RepID=UPI00210C855D|nr:hypothetical protein [Streptomyces sp. DpondAA-D4]
MGELIVKLYRVRLTEPGVGTYLKLWRLHFQHLDKRAVEQGPGAVARRHQETWPTIRAKAKADGGEILFVDQVGIRSDQVTGRTWGENGSTPVVRPPYSPELNPDELVNAERSTVCPSSTGPETRPNSPPRTAASSADARASRTSSAATSAARTSTTPWTRTP